MRYYCIGDEATVTGFKLAGVEGKVVRTAAETRALFQSVVTISGVGIVIITEKMAGLIREDVEKFEAGADLPLVVEIPDRDGPAMERKSLAQIVRHAVGVKV